MRRGSKAGMLGQRAGEGTGATRAAAGGAEFFVLTEPELVHGSRGGEAARGRGG